VPATRSHRNPDAVCNWTKPGVLRQRLSAGGGLLAPGRDFRGDFFRCISGCWGSLDAVHTVIEGGRTV